MVSSQQGGICGFNMAAFPLWIGCQDPCQCWVAILLGFSPAECPQIWKEMPTCSINAFIWGRTLEPKGLAEASLFAWSWWHMVTVVDTHFSCRLHSSSMCGTCHCHLWIYGLWVLCQSKSHINPHFRVCCEETDSRHSSSHSRRKGWYREGPSKTLKRIKNQKPPLNLRLYCNSHKLRPRKLLSPWSHLLLVARTIDWQQNQPMLTIMQILSIAVTS